MRTDIRARDDGPLAGRTVAIKDNTAVAGVPMMNGSRTLEGFVPRQDATVVSRLLAAGATVTGKAVCEDLCFSGGQPHVGDRPRTQPVGPVPDRGRLVQRQRGAGGRGPGGPGPRRRPGRLDPDPERVLRHRRAQTHLRPGPLHRRVPDRVHHRPPGPDHPHGGRRGADAGACWPAGTGRTPASPTASSPPTTWRPSGKGPPACGSGWSAEGFGIPGLSQPEVDTTVRAAITRLGEAGLAVDEVSVPWHRHAMHVWNVIATDGARPR